MNKLYENFYSTKTNLASSPIYIKANIKWKQNATTVAGGNERGEKLNQFDHPHGIFINHHQQSIYVADWGNHRIVTWKLAKNNKESIPVNFDAYGSKIYQLYGSVIVIVDENSKFLIISDIQNERIVRWSLQNQQDKQIVIPNVKCYGLIVCF